MTRRRSISITPECFARVESYCEATGQSASSFVSQLVESAMSEPLDRTLISKVKRNMAFARRKTACAAAASNLRLAGERRRLGR